MPKVAIVILNWNGCSLLEKFLPLVITHSPGAEIIVADNASTDDSISYLTHHFKNVRTIRFSSNHGFAGGYNRALEQVHASYFMLLNTDVEVLPGWLTPLVDFLDSHPEVAACQPKIRSFDQRHLFEHAGAAGGFIDRYGYPFCRGRMFTTLETDHGQYDQPTPIFWATGACMLIRSDVFKKLNGFDERFFAHMEEIDLCWRIHRAGYRVYCIPESTVFHIGGATLPKQSARKTYFNFRNNLMMLHNNLPPAVLLPTLLIRLFLDGLACLKFFLEGHVKDAGAVLQAHAWFHLNVLLTGGRRKILSRQLPFCMPSTIYQGSIVWDYFFRGKKTYSQLNFTPA
jgi:GT2 family glycosyltransferase